MTKVIARAECFTTSSRVALVIGQRSSAKPVSKACLFRGFEDWDAVLCTIFYI
jgi:hypothetical protein